MTWILVPALVVLASIGACHAIAKRRGGSPVFWGVMGLLFGPLAIPFALLARPNRREQTQAGAPPTGSDAERRSDVPPSDLRIR